MTKNSDTLSPDNWRGAVIGAVEGLPEDIRASVGHSLATDDRVTVTVACEPTDGDEETEIQEIEVRWWTTRREQLEALAEDEPDDLEYGMRWVLEQERQIPSLCEDVESPVIGIEGPDGMGIPVEGVVPGRASVGLLKRKVQEMILELLWGGGGISMIDKDEEGRFRRENGSLILPVEEDPAP